MEREPVYKIIPQNPEKKDYTKVKPMDVARFEYGDFDNWVNAIILDIKVQETDYGGPKPVKEAVIRFATTYGSEETCYSNIYNDKLDFDIVGKAVKLKKDKIRTSASQDENAMTM